MTATLRPHLPDWTPGNVRSVPVHAAALVLARVNDLRAAREAAERLAERAFETKKPYAEQIKDAGVKAYVWEKTS